MKRVIFFILLLYSSDCFSQNNAASLVGTKWLFEETNRMAISFELTFKEKRKALLKGTNTPISEMLNWFGAMDNIRIEGNFGSGSTIVLQGSLNSGILNYSTSWLINGKSGSQNGQYKVTKMQSIIPIQKINPPQSVQKTMTLTFKGIFMGECGNPNNCHHEPVAGKVEAYLVHRPTGSRINNTTQNTIIWQNGAHVLVCDNYPISSDGYNGGSGMGDRLSYDYKPMANNVNRRFSYMVDDISYQRGEYDLVVKFNLGVVHKDSPIAGAGGHWLTSGDNLITERIKLLPPPNNLRTIGSFQTNSDRCHEFWL